MGRSSEATKRAAAAADKIEITSATLTMVHDDEYDQPGRRIERAFRGYLARRGLTSGALSFAPAWVKD